MTGSGKVQVFICFNFFISPASPSKTWSLLHPRTEVPEDRHSMGVALGQWHRAGLRQWAALMASDCRKNRLQGQQAKPMFFSISLDKRVGMEREDTSWQGGVMLCWAHAQHWTPLLRHQCPAGRSRDCPFFLTCPQFSNAGCQQHAKVLCLLPSAAQGKAIYLSVAKI